MAEQLYRYHWGNNPTRAKLKGRICRVLKSGGMNTIMLEFLDNGERVSSSRQAIRRVKHGC